MTTIDPALMEKAARALFTTAYGERAVWEDAHPQYRLACTNDAQAALSAVLPDALAEVTYLQQSRDNVLEAAERDRAEARNEIERLRVAVQNAESIANSMDHFAEVAQKVEYRNNELVHERTGFKVEHRQQDGALALAAKVLALATRPEPVEPSTAEVEAASAAVRHAIYTYRNAETNAERAERYARAALLAARKVTPAQAPTDEAGS